jgi:Xaa-Pro aminopeptidase
MLKLQTGAFCGVQSVDKPLKTRIKCVTNMPQKTSQKSDSSRIERLRAQMRLAKVTAYLVPRQDEFQGEYVPDYAERLKWLTGFAGSWGVAIVRLKDAHIFVDGRYTIQVKEQVDTKVFTPQHLITTPPHQWAERNLKKGDRLGFDPWLTTAADADKFAAACEKVGAKLVPLGHNLIDVIWEDQPPRPDAPIAAHPTQFAGLSTEKKLEQIGKSLEKAGAESVVLAEPSSVAWLFNIRGGDIPFTPVVPAYAIVRRKGKAEIFIDPAKVPEDVVDHIAKHAVIKKRQQFETALGALGRKKSGILLDHASVPAAIRNALSKVKARLVSGSDPCTLPKAQKNKTEQEGARAAQRRDGVAMVRFLHWLEQDAPRGALTEWSVAQKLHEFRAASPEFKDASFGTISAAGPNAAIPHYHVSEESSLPLRMNEIFLIDSGGQYEDGTTDITRTVIVGQPTDEMRDRFTRVLKGMIQISMLRFPAGTTGAHIDVLARAALWKAGLDFDHGTGHGVGSYLSVHEGPARISKTGHVALQPGMIMSDEPGYYLQGQYGIRIENLLLVTPPAKIDGGDREMLGFETLTLCPIDRRLIDSRLLTREELDWLDAYHARVWRELRPFMDGPEATWLTRVCGPVR